MNGLTQAFLSVLNMSITASYVVIAVLTLRLLLRRAPKVFSYALWAAAFFRFVCPVSFSSQISMLSLLRTDHLAGTPTLNYVPRDIALAKTPIVDVGISSANAAVNGSLPASTPFASVNPMQVLLALASLLWVIGIAALSLYAAVSYIRTKNRLRTAYLSEAGFYVSDHIATALVCGFFRPRVYVPAGVREEDLPYILAHEQTHIKRHDYLIKPLAFAALIIHWFNPFAWLFFVLLGRDMELSCDESVLRTLNDGAQCDYSAALLALSCRNRRLLSASPLAFGESSVKTRIKNALHYKKPAFWGICTAVLLVAAAVVLLVANPAAKAKPPQTLAEKLLEYRTEYVGDNSKVGGILSQLSYPTSLTYAGFALQTTQQPYEITVKLKDGGNFIEQYKKDAPGGDLARNATILFSLIGNVDEINFDVSASAGKQTIQIPRKLMETLMGGDLRQLSSTAEEYDQFLKRLDAALQPASLSSPTTSAQPTDSASTSVAQEIIPDSIKEVVEDNLAVILSSPMASSNPQDYIDAHSLEYEKIIKYGGEQGLTYMLAQFESGNADGLRGVIMMRLCKELLGVRNNVSDPSLSPQEWYQKLSVRQEIRLPDYVYSGNDKIEQLVYGTETDHYRSTGGFTVIACDVFGSYEEGDRLKVFVTTFAQTFRLYGNALSEEGGSVVPVAITYRKAADGSYSLDQYEQAKDGSYFAPSIRAFCTMPVSGKKIAGLADKMLSQYGNSAALRNLLREHLQEHLRANGQGSVQLPS